MNSIDKDGRDICGGCGCEIDPRFCWCGDDYEGHKFTYDHHFVPMGCSCGFHKSQSENMNLENLKKETIK